MNNSIGRIKSTRQFLIKLVEDLSVDDLNKVPEGFNNNIIWNVGHMLVSQQGICYTRAGAKPVIDEKYFMQYKPGTKPEQQVDREEVDKIKELLLSAIDKLEMDYQTDIFVNYPAWSTRYGVEIASIDDAIEFLMYHEGMHTGIIMAMKKLVSSQ